jgi:hypothetical protein
MLWNLITAPVRIALLPITLPLGLVTLPIRLPLNLLATPVTVPLELISNPAPYFWYGATYFGSFWLLSRASMAVNATPAAAPAASGQVAQFIRLAKARWAA